MERFTSLKNEQVRRWKSLRTKKGREETGCILAEGHKLSLEAFDSGYEIEAVLLADGTDAPEELPPDIRVVYMPAQVLDAICDTVTPQGIAVVTRIPATQALKGRHLLALDGVQDPGNVGTLIRTADAAGLDGVLLSEQCADPWSPKVVRASMGSIFHLPVQVTHDLPDALQAHSAVGHRLIATLLDAPTLSRETSILDGAAAFTLVMGSEGSGITPPVRKLCKTGVRLPMRGRAESLNVAVAGGILMYRLMEELVP